MTEQFDTIIRNGLVYDGRGSPPLKADIGIREKKIAAIGDLSAAHANHTLDAQGKIVAPGFINVMSWAPITLLQDGRSLSDLQQGVTLEVFGEAWSEGPLTPQMKQDVLDGQGDFKFDVPWDTLGGFLSHLETRGTSCNFASYLGCTTLRIYAVGYDDRPPTAEELETMRALVRQGMEEGALGISTALIYPPGAYAKTDELVELAKVAAKYDGIYISHLRSEGNQFLQGLGELFEIAEQAGIKAEIYHLKAMGVDNWHKMNLAIGMVNATRARGLRVTADMYTYPAGGTGLTASLPPWVQAGGFDAFTARLRDPETRARVKAEMSTPTDAWENIYLMSGKPENVLLTEFATEALKPLQGKTLAEVASARGTDPFDTILDLILEDNTRVEAIYFTMTEENLERQLMQPWVCIGSDAPSQAPEGLFLNSRVHPRAYGCFSRYLAKFVRDQRLLPLEEALRKITSLPADNLRLQGRGSLLPGYYADIVIFDLNEIGDNATFADPQVLATGMSHVFVNGTQVIADGNHTGALPGMAVRGPGYIGN